MPALPGTPKTTVGISAPPSRELVALSAAMTPRTSPLPKLCCAPFSVLSAWPYDIQSITDAPMPGIAPRVDPSAEQRTTRNQLSKQSLMP